MLRDARRYSDNVSACTLCLSCDNVCPSKVGPGSQIYLWRQKLDSLHRADPMKKFMSMGMEALFEHPHLYAAALRLAPLANIVPDKITRVRGVNPWSVGHTKPEFAKESFQDMWKKGKV